MLPPNPNSQTARQLLTDLLPGKHVVMFDPKRPSKIITQCVRVSEHVYYLSGPQFNDFTAPLLDEALGEVGSWELPGLFEAGRADKTSEAELVQLINDFLRAHGARREDGIFTCTSLADVLATLQGLFAAYRSPTP
ncbi:MAG: hypothetical protein ACRYFX_05665 [Janthinobacterium lividum]